MFVIAILVADEVTPDRGGEHVVEMAQIHVVRVTRFEQILDRERRVRACSGIETVVHERTSSGSDCPAESPRDGGRGTETRERRGSGALCHSTFGRDLAPQLL